MFAPSLLPSVFRRRDDERSWKFIARLWPPAAAAIAAVEVGLQLRLGLDRKEGRKAAGSNVGGHGKIAGRGRSRPCPSSCKMEGGF